MRPCRGDAMEIYLTQNKKTSIDNEMSHLKNFKWFFNKTGYAARTIRHSNGKTSISYLHHYVIGHPINDYVVDHIDQNTLNNKISNLRIISNRDNCLNRSHSKNGVSFCRQNKKNPWKTSFYENGRQIHLGYFSTRIQALEAYTRRKG